MDCVFSRTRILVTQNKCKLVVDKILVVVVLSSHSEGGTNKEGVRL